MRNTISVSRRQFLRSTSAAGAFCALPLGAVAAWPGLQTIPRRSEPMKILILGGTRFLGPALVQAALARGHTVTLFNRGRSNPHLFPELEKLRGDRDPNVGDGLSALEGRTFDGVLDTSGFVPRIVRASAELLAPSVKQYVFVSSLSVYADQSKPGLTETDALAGLEDPTVEEVDGSTYGPLKAACERAIEEVMPGSGTYLRPCVISGPEDPYDRLTYWVVRIDRGGEVLAPGDGNDPVQLIDVRDLAEFSVICLETGTTGSYNTCGPRGRMTMAQMLHGCRAVTTAETRLTWAPAEFLAEHEVQPWSHMPMWVPSDSAFAGITQANNTKAIAKGLSFRPFAVTSRDTLDWFKTLPAERQAELRAGLPPEKEADVLEAWHASQDASSDGG